METEYEKEKTNDYRFHVNVQGLSRVYIVSIKLYKTEITYITSLVETCGR